MIFRVVAADWLKLRHSWVMWLSLLGPMGMIVAQSVNYGVRYDYLIDAGWNGIGDKGLLYWVDALIPLTVMLGATLLASIAANGEHDAHAWKQLLVQPVPKVLFLWSKLFWLILFLCFSAVVMVLLVGAFGYLIDIPGEIPWKDLISVILFPAFSSIPFLIFQLWLSLFFQNPAWPIVIGSVGSIMGQVWASNEHEWVRQVLFWAYPSLFDPGVQPEHWVFQVMVSSVILLALLTIHWMRKEMN